MQGSLGDRVARRQHYLLVPPHLTKSQHWAPPPTQGRRFWGSLTLVRCSSLQHLGTQAGAAAVSSIPSVTPTVWTPWVPGFTANSHHHPSPWRQSFAMRESGQFSINKIRKQHPHICHPRSPRGLLWSACGWEGVSSPGQRCHSGTGEAGRWRGLGVHSQWLASARPLWTRYGGK